MNGRESTRRVDDGARDPRPPLTQDEIGFLIGLGSVVLGAGLYLYPPGLAGFPINDGGLFYAMIRAIQQDGYRLPDFVYYNGLSIPFTYPPAGFYVGALVSDAFGIGLLKVLQWLPAVILIGISIAFWFLALRMLGSRLEAGIATFLYVCTPRTMTSLIMGGGLTRGLGQLFLILTVTSLYAMFTERRRRFLLLSILFGTLVVLTHPEALLHAVAGCVLIWTFRGRSRRGSIDALVVALGVAALSAIWWLPKLVRFGIDPFVSAAQTGLHTGIILIYPLLMTFSEEPAVAIIAALGLIGIFGCIAKRQYLLPIWMFLPFAVEPRGAANVAVIPLAMMAAIALAEIVLPGVSGLAGKARTEALGSRMSVLFGGYLAAFLLIMGTYAGTQLAQTRLSNADQAAFHWVASNLPAQSRFLILTGAREVFCDPVQEWFPALTPSRSQTTIQGFEWAANEAFFSRVAVLQSLQGCLYSDSPLECVRTEANGAGLQFDFVYVSQRLATDASCRPNGQAPAPSAIVSELAADQGFQSVYKAPGVAIFAAKP